MAQGHRIIEVGCVELVNRRPTGRVLHHYLQPDREIDPGAMAVHGITPQMLAGKPGFGEIAVELLAFLEGAELIIHNADFDMGFLSRELVKCGYAESHLQACCIVTDTLKLARQLWPGQRNSLDALCRRYGVDNSGREYHGALRDARLLADVYLAMTGGQVSLVLDEQPGTATTAPADGQRFERAGIRLRVLEVGEADREAHEHYLDFISSQSRNGVIWRATRPAEPPR